MRRSQRFIDTSGFLLFFIAITACSDPYEGSCPYKNDGECDEPDLCRPGTDVRDCMAAEPTATGQSDDSDFPDYCPYYDDGECDEPEGTNICDEGSDPNDCGSPDGCRAPCSSDADCSATPTYTICTMTYDGTKCLPPECANTCFVGDGGLCYTNSDSCAFSYCEPDDSGDAPDACGTPCDGTCASPLAVCTDSTEGLICAPPSCAADCFPLGLTCRYSLDCLESYCE